MTDFWQRYFGQGGYDFNSPPPGMPGNPWGGIPKDQGIDMPLANADIAPFWQIDPRSVYNPDEGIPLGFGSGFLGLGGDQKVYDQQSLSDLVSELRGSSPESLPNPVPYDWNNQPYDQYGAPPNIPTYELPPSQIPGMQDLFNPNTAPSTPPPGFENIGWTPPPGMPPGQEMNFGASEFPNIPGGGDVSAAEIGFPPSTLGGGNVTADQLVNPPGLYPQYQQPGTNIQDFGGPAIDWGQPPSPVLEAAGGPSGVAQTEGETDFGGFPVGGGGTPESANQILSDDGQFVYNYDQNWNWINQTPAGPGGIFDDTSAGGGGGGGPGFVGGAAGTPPTGYYGPTGPNVVGGANPGLLPNAPGLNYAPPIPGMLDSNGNVIPGTAVSPEGNANAYNMEQFPGGGVGQFLKDAAGNIIDSTGNILVSAAQAVGKLPGQIASMISGVGGSIANAGGALVNNIMNDPRNTDPAYLARMGYTPGAGTNSMWPGQASTSGFGVEGRGGSFFGGTMNLNPGLSSPYQGFIPTTQNPGQVVSSSVQAPSGGGGPPMYGPLMLSGFMGSAGLSRPYSPMEWGMQNATETWRGGKGGQGGSYYDYLKMWHNPMTRTAVSPGMSGLQYAMSGAQPGLFGTVPRSWFQGITPFVANQSAPVVGQAGRGSGIQRGDIGPSPQMQHAAGGGHFSPK